MQKTYIKHHAVSVTIHYNVFIDINDLFINGIANYVVDDKVITNCKNSFTT